MANDTTGNPWVLDTAASIQTKPVTIKKMWWTPTTSGDDLLVQNNAAKTVWSEKALAADSNQGIKIDWPGENVMVGGFNLVTIDNGTLYVIIE